MNTTGLRIGTLAVVAALSGCQSVRVGSQDGHRHSDVLGKDQRAFAEALALYSQGLIHELHRDYETALGYYSRAVQLDPENEELYFRVATGLLQQRRNDEAVTLMEELAEKRPQSPKALRWLALIYRAADMPGKSEGAYRQWITVDPTHSAPYIQLASLYVKEKRADEAIALLEDAREKVSTPLELLRALADVHLEVSRDAATKPKLDESIAAAIGVYEHVLSLEPDDQLALNRLGELYEEHDQHQRAVAFFESLEGQIPNNLLLKEKLAENLLSLGEKHKALRVLERMVVLDAANPRLHFYLGDLYQQIGELDKATESFQRAISTAPTDPAGYLKLAVLSMVKDPDNAADVLLDGLRRIPNDETLLKTLAHVYFSHAEYAKAAKYFGHALAVMEDQAEPEISPNFLFNYAVASMRADQLDVTTSMLQRAMASNAAFLDAFVQFIFAQEGTEDARRSSFVISRLLADIEDLPRLHYYLGLVRNYLKDYAAAVESFEAFEKALADAPALTEDTELVGAPFHFWFGAALERVGRHEDAETRFLKVVELDPENGESFNYLAYMWAEQNQNLERGLEYIEKALELDPDSGAYVDTLGWIYYQMGQYEKALTEIKRATELMPDDPTIVDHLGDVLLKAGDLDQALGQWKHSFILDPESEAVAKKLAEHGVDLDALRLEADAYRAAREEREVEDGLDDGVPESPAEGESGPAPDESPVPTAASPMP